MKYLVNRETKEHVLCATGPYPDSGVWRIVEADAEGWIKWEGGECPVRSFKHVEFRCINDSYASVAEAGNLRWELEGRASDIGSYRPILPEERKPTLEQTRDEIENTAEGDVFKRLADAVAASDSIPALIAEINAMLPEGYEVREKAKPQAAATIPSFQYTGSVRDYLNNCIPVTK